MPPSRGLRFGDPLRRLADIIPSVVDDRVGIIKDVTWESEKQLSQPRKKGGGRKKNSLK